MRPGLCLAHNPGPTSTAQEFRMHLASLHLHPLKSCAPLSRETLEIEARGPRHDRRWLAVNAEGRFLTGREHARMVAILAEPDQTGGLRLAAPEMPALHVPATAADAPRRTITVWKDTVDAADCGDAAAAWLGEYLGQPARLVHMDARAQRAVDAAYAQPGDQVAFADGYPLLAISQAALDGLNARLAAAGRAPVAMAQFRPNLVIADAPAHAEDGWRRLRIGEIEFDAVKPCTRCVFTTVDVPSAARRADGEPLNTLKDYRRTPAGITFGMNLIARGSGTLRVGDAVTVLA